MRVYSAVIERDPQTELFVGFVPGFPGAHSQGATLDELNSNLQEVISMLLEDGELIRDSEFVRYPERGSSLSKRSIMCPFERSEKSGATVPSERSETKDLIMLISHCARDGNAGFLPAVGMTQTTCAESRLAVEAARSV